MLHPPAHRREVELYGNTNEGEESAPEASPGEDLDLELTEEHTDVGQSADAEPGTRVPHSLLPYYLSQPHVVPTAGPGSRSPATDPRTADSRTGC